MRSPVGAICAPAFVDNRQNQSPITVSAPQIDGGNVSRVQVADGTVYQTASHDASTNYEAVRLDFGSSILIQDFTPVVWYGVPVGGGFLVARTFRVYGSQDITNKTLIETFTTNNNGAALDPGTPTAVNASYRYLHIYTQSRLDGGSLYDGTSAFDAIEVTGEL